MNKPFSQACENNKEPIRKVLERYFEQAGNVLEIGSGTGQHAVWFARHLPQLVWQTSDLSENHPGIQQWIDEAGLANLKPPIELDVSSQSWPVEQMDYIFSANTAHIMPWAVVVKMFEGIGRVLVKDGVFCLYGPFNYQGQFTSDSNEAFDQHLKNMEPHRGIRDFEAIQQQAGKNGLSLLEDVAMPANNRLLVWRKR